MTTVERLRHHANTLRTNSIPLKDLIPLLQQAADELDRKQEVISYYDTEITSLKHQLIDLKHKHHDF